MTFSTQCMNDVAKQAMDCRERKSLFAQSSVNMYMRTTSLAHRPWQSDDDIHLWIPFLFLSGSVLVATTLTVYLYAAM